MAVRDHGRAEEEEPLTPTQRHSNVFGDEHEVDDGDVADGFRPSENDNADDSNETQSIHNAAAYYTNNPRMTFSPDILPRNSTRKSHSNENPFASADDNDTSTTPITRTPSTRSNYAPGHAFRTFSSASSQHYASTNSPRLGAAGPSHPYTMYPQGTIVRSSSSATASTTHPVRRSSSLRGGPQHPYTMYPQNIADSDDDEGEERVANPVPVGFGLGQIYRRVRGPEGEEQDIIGEYGHAEQLPPYSRFPDDGPEKTALLAVPEGTHTRAPVEGSDPGMPLMHQQMSRQSMTDVSNLIEQAEPLLQPEHDATSTNEASSLGSEKRWKEKSWKERRKTTFCGIRFGWCLFALIGAAFIGAILIGSLVGYLAGSGHRSGTATAVTVITTSLYDASPIATPSGGPATGTFALTLGTPQATQSDCLIIPSQRAAWRCDLAGEPAVAISVGFPPPPAPSMGAFLSYASTNKNITYGAQYQFLETSSTPLIPVRDNDDPNLGPAYFFQQTYDKVVVLPRDTFPVPGKVKREYGTRPHWHPSYDWSQKKQVQHGDQPWFCFFNNTSLEGFLYISQRALLNKTAATSSSLSPTSQTTVTTSSSTAATTSTGYAGYNSYMTHDYGMTAAPTSIPSLASSYIAAAQAARESYTASLQARDEGQFENSWSSLYPYPVLVKLEERRLANNTIQPYCQLFQILDNGSYGTVVDHNGQTIAFDLQEEDPSFGAYQSAGIASSSKRGNIPNGCHCQWMHGQ